MHIALDEYIKEKITLINKPLGKEYSYSCIPLAIVDAVYSIQQSYTQAENAVKKLLHPLRHCYVQGG